MFPPSEKGDGVLPSLSNRPGGILDCCLSPGNTSGGGVVFTGADGAAGAAETIGEYSDSTVSLDQSLLSSILPSAPTTPPLSSTSLPALLAVASSRASVFVPGPARHLIAAAKGDHPG